MRIYFKIKQFTLNYTIPEDEKYTYYAWRRAWLMDENMDRNNEATHEYTGHVKPRNIKYSMYNLGLPLPMFLPNYEYADINSITRAMDNIISFRQSEVSYGGYTSEV